MQLPERVSFRLLKVGSCSHLECMAIAGGRWRSVEFPSLCALIGHPSRGWMLYDTGYSDRFLSATDSFPERFYRMLTPVDLHPPECLLTQLKGFGIEADDIREILVSHFHGDHIAGLRDFSRCGFTAMRADWEQVRGLSRWRGVLDGFLPALLPNNFTDRLRFTEDRRQVELPAWLQPFTTGYDLFDDGALIAVPLPGHSRAQMGLLLRDTTDRIRFLVADACWSLPACRDGALPAALTGLIFADTKQYRQTFSAVRQIAIREPSLSLLPSHCGESWRALEKENV